MNCSGFVGWRVDIISCGLMAARTGCGGGGQVVAGVLIVAPFGRWSFLVCLRVFRCFGRCARALAGRLLPSPSALRFAPVRGSLRAPGTSAYGHVSRGNALRMRLNCNFIRLRRRQL